MWKHEHRLCILDKLGTLYYLEPLVIFYKVGIDDGSHEEEDMILGQGIHGYKILYTLDFVKP